MVQVLNELFDPNGQYVSFLFLFKLRLTIVVGISILRRNITLLHFREAEIKKKNILVKIKKTKDEK